MIFSLHKYAHWLHGKWPAGVPEPLPEQQTDGSTTLPGVFIVGDLTGIPLLKFALDSGARVAERCCAEIKKNNKNSADYDVIILGGGVAGMAAAIACAKNNVRFTVVEAAQPFNTIANFPAGKPIFTYPTAMTPNGALQVSAENKETLLSELQQQISTVNIPMIRGAASHVSQDNQVTTVHIKEQKSITAHKVIIALGRSGNFRRLQVPGEELAHVTNRLHDPKIYAGKALVVVGGGDSALEAAIACADAGARVTLIHRSGDFSRAKAENAALVQQYADQQRLTILLSTQINAVTEQQVTLNNGKTIAADVVLVLIGREPPLDFFRRSGIGIRGELSWRTKSWLVFFLLLMTGLYAWKGWIIPPLTSALSPEKLLPAISDPTSVMGVIVQSAHSPGFWVTLLYSAVVVGFGIDRMRRRKTPYVRVQTLTLMAIQCLPLFILPEIILPWMWAHDAISHTIQVNLFPLDHLGNPQWWKAYGFILAWPLMAWNVFTNEPNTWWLIISFVQTFIIIPFIVWRWGKGAYCGWICSCGALAETLGDRHRHKMPHGKSWNKLNFIGQAVLASAFIILALHIISWTAPHIISPHLLEVVFMKGYWKHAVDFLLAGALGVGLYFWLSGRVWCRFACPLAALMHIYARFSRFRILVEQKKCISCNACTSVCHQGIDIMNFANQGKHMEDPQCVRCSACVQTCPTGVLSFGAVDKQGIIIARDSLAARVE
jgi:NosR/NirI family transcriptional regulator, nitrous oxide reductase regulator